MGHLKGQDQRAIYNFNATYVARNKWMHGATGKVEESESGVSRFWNSGLRVKWIMAEGR